MEITSTTSTKPILASVYRGYWEILDVNPTSTYIYHIYFFHCDYEQGKRLNIMSFTALDLKLDGRHDGPVINFGRQSLEEGFSKELTCRQKDARRRKRKQAKQSRRRNRAK